MASARHHTARSENGDCVLVSSAAKFPKKISWQSSHRDGIRPDGDTGGESKRFERTAFSSETDIRNGTPEAHLAWTDGAFTWVADVEFDVSTFSLFCCHCKDMLAANAQDGGALSNDTYVALFVYERGSLSLYEPARANKDLGGV